MEVYYKFLKNMWVLGKVDEEYLQKQVDFGRLTQEEYNKIIELQKVV